MEEQGLGHPPKRAKIINYISMEENFDVYKTEQTLQNVWEQIQEYVEKANEEKLLLEAKILDFYSRLKGITEELNPEILFKFTFVEDRDILDAEIKYSLLKNIMDDYKETFEITIQRNGKI